MTRWLFRRGVGGLNHFEFVTSVNVIRFDVSTVNSDRINFWQSDDVFGKCGNSTIFVCARAIFRTLPRSFPSPKGIPPQTILYNTTPSDQISVFQGSYGVRNRISGAQYPKDPQNVVLCHVSLVSVVLLHNLENPKSQSFMLCSWSSRMFSIFMSRCATRFWWRYCNADVSCLNHLRAWTKVLEINLLDNY